MLFPDAHRSQKMSLTCPFLTPSHKPQFLNDFLKPQTKCFACRQPQSTGDEVFQQMKRFRINKEDVVVVSLAL